MIEAYNSTKSRAVDGISLRSYNLETLEQALSEMRGETAPSPGAQGATAAAQSGSAGGKAVKRKLEECTKRSHLAALLLIGACPCPGRQSSMRMAASAKNVSALRILTHSLTVRSLCSSVSSQSRTARGA